MSLRKSQQQSIDEAAAARFSVIAAENNWIAQRLAPDYGIDYQLILAPSDPGATVSIGGNKILVQLKGTRQFKKSKHGVSLAVSVRHLEYYVDSCRDAVFIVHIDIGTGQSYWLLVQEYMARLLDQNWRSQKKFTVYFGEQDFDQQPHFRDRVIEASRRAPLLTPKLLKDSIIAQEHYLKRMDPRLTPKISVSSRGESMSVDSTEPISFSLQMLGKKQAVDEFWTKLQAGHGPLNPADFDIKLSAKNLPLQIGETVDISSIDMARRQKARITLFVLEPDSRKHPALEINGDVRFMLNEFTATASLSTSLFSIDLRGTACADHAMRVTTSYKFDIDRLRKYDARMWADLNGMTRLVPGLKNGSRLIIQMWTDGQMLLEHGIDCSSEINVHTLLRAIKAFSAVHQIAVKTDQRIVLTEKMGSDDFRDLEMLAELWFERSTKFATESIVLDIDTDRSSLSQFDGATQRGQVTLVGGSVPIRALGRIFEFKPIRITLTQATLSLLSTEEMDASTGKCSAAVSLESEEDATLEWPPEGDITVHAE